MTNRIKVLFICDPKSKCHIFPGITKRLRWPVDDPAAIEGTEAEKLDAIRKIRDSIKAWLFNPPQNTIDVKALIDK
jgi:arsenate reductase (thioredoxin)